MTPEKAAPGFFCFENGRWAVGPGVYFTGYGGHNDDVAAKSAAAWELFSVMSTSTSPDVIRIWRPSMLGNGSDTISSLAFERTSDPAPQAESPSTTRMEIAIRDAFFLLFTSYSFCR